MARRLVNVRLDEEHLRRARVLRERGVTLSDLVREAIDARYGETSRVHRPQDVREVLDAILRQYPDPAGLPPRGYDVADSRRARKAIRARLRRKRR